MKRNVVLTSMFALVSTSASLAAQAVAGLDVPSESELRIGVIFAPTQRNYVYGGSVSSGQGSIIGGEILARTKWVGLGARIQTGTYTEQLKIINGDIWIVAGHPALSLEGGFSRRAATNEVATQQYSFARLGARLTLRIGGSGLRASFGAWQYLAIGNDASRLTGGREGETQLIYTLASAPIYFMLGYRAETFTTRALSVLASTLPEEVHGLRLGAGLQWGGR